MSSRTGLNIEVTSDSRWLPDVRDRLRAWARAHGWSAQQVDELVLALDEALTNVIRHGYNCEPHHRILVAVQCIHDADGGDGCEIRVRDFGRQVDPAQIRGRDLDDVRPGGLGVHIIRAMSSSVEYQRAAGGGMLLIMRKFRTHTAGSAPAGE